MHECFIFLFCNILVQFYNSKVVKIKIKIIGVGLSVDSRSALNFYCYFSLNCRFVKIHRHF